MTWYKGRVHNELLHYQKFLQGRMALEVPAIWGKVEERFADLMESATGVRNLYQYVARHVTGMSTVELLGLGSGACGNELNGIAPLLAERSCQLCISCVDINPAVLEEASEQASKRGIRFEGKVQDANQISLEPDRYDVIVAYASLHHFIKLDHIAYEINRALRQNGIFVTVDIPARNGYYMWSETSEIVNAIWKVLPAKFKIAHVGYREPTYVASYETKYSSLLARLSAKLLPARLSGANFECVNSEAILPALRKHLRKIHFVPAFPIARRFFDTKFGPNFDWNQSIDRAIFEFIMQLDTYYLDSGLLRPETFFGAYAKRTLE